MTLTIEQETSQQARVLRLRAAAAFHRVGGQLDLHFVPQCLVNDRCMLARVMLALMDDLAAIDPVPQHQVQRAPGKGPAAPASAPGALPTLAADAVSFQLFFQ
jgi:hypothetical protein